MRRPLVSLLIAGEEMQATCDLKEKKISIRQGKRDYRAKDQLALVCHITKWCGPLATIESVQHKTIEDVTLRECRDDGFENHEEMLEGLREFYPNLTMDATVTVIRWEYN